MAIKINIGFGERITSAGINDKIASIAGKDFKIEGLEARFTGVNQITVSPGKCMIQGAVIESDADITVEIPADMQSKTKLALVGIYDHEQRSFEIKVYPDCYIDMLHLADIDMASRGVDNKLEKMDSASILGLLENPDKVEIKRFVSEAGEEIVFDTLHSNNKHEILGSMTVTDSIFEESQINMQKYSDAIKIVPTPTDFTLIFNINASLFGVPGSYHGVVFHHNTGDISAIGYISQAGQIFINSTGGLRLLALQGENERLRGGVTYSIAIVKDGQNYSVWVDGIKRDLLRSGETQAPEIPNGEMWLGKKYGSYLNTDSTLTGVRVYDRALTDEEITHNLKALEANRDYIEHRVDTASVKIEGETVKNLVPEISNSNSLWVIRNYADSIIPGKNGFDFTVKPGSTLHWSVAAMDMEISPNTDYELIVNVTHNSLTKNVSILQGIFQAQRLILAGETGILRFPVKTSSVLDNKVATFYIEPGGIEGKRLRIEGVSLIKPDESVSCTTGINSGLNSVSANIANNDIEHPIYNPVITGSTKIMKDGQECAAGTAGAKLVSLEPTDKSLPALGRTKTHADSIDYNKNIIYKNTLKYRLSSESASWIIDDAGSGQNTSKYTFRGDNWAGVGKVHAWDSDTGICNALQWCNTWGELPVADKEGIAVDSNGHIIISISRQKVSNLQEFKDYIDTNRIEIIAQTKTPQTIQLTDEQLQAYDAHREIIELNKVGDVADTLEIMEDGSALWTQRTNTRVFNGSEDWRYSSSNDTHTKAALLRADISPLSAISDVWDCDILKKVIDSNDANPVSQGICRPQGNYVISVSNSELSSVSLDGFKKWVSLNKPTIIYELATPIITKIPASLVPQFLQQHHNEITTNRISLKSAVAGKLTVTAPTTPNDNHRELREMMLAQKAEHEATRTSVTTSDGEEIVINQGSEVGSAAIAKIAGQTVKNYFAYPQTLQPNGSVAGYNAKTHKVIGSVSKTWNYTYFDGSNPAVMKQVNKLPIGFYNIIISDIEYISGPYDEFLATKKTFKYDFSGKLYEGTPFEDYCIIPFEVKTEGYAWLYINCDPTIPTKNITFSYRVSIVPVDTVNDNYSVPFGLNSTQASLSVQTENGTVTTNVYDTTIQGQTKIMKDGIEVAAGTAGAKLVGLKSIGGDSQIELDGTPLRSDILDIPSKIITKNTKRIVYTGVEGWFLYQIYETADTIQFYVSCPDSDYNTHFTGVCCDRLPSSVLSSTANDERVSLNNSLNVSIWVRIRKDRLSTPDVPGFKAWLAQNPLTVVYVTNKPEMTQLTDEQIKSFLHHRKIIELHKVGDVSDTFTVNDDGSGTWTRNTWKLYMDRAKSYYYRNDWEAKGLHGFQSADLPIAIGSYIVVSDKYTYYSRVTTEGTETTHANIMGHRSNNCIYASLPSDYAGGKTSDDVNNYLRLNPFSVIYQLEKPRNIHIPKELMPQIPLALNPGRNEVVAGGAIKPTALEVKRVHGDKAIEKTSEISAKVYSEIEAKTNGLARIVGGKIEGRTVKNYCDNVNKNVAMTNKTLVAGTSPVYTSFIVPVEPNTAYRVCREKPITCRFMIGESTDYPVAGQDFSVIHGVYYSDDYKNTFIDIKTGLNTKYLCIYLSNKSETTCVSVIHGNDASFTSEFQLPGLNASKAIIANGDFEAVVKDPETGEVIELNAVGDYKDSIEFGDDGSAVWTRKISHLFSDGVNSPAGTPQNGIGVFRFGWHVPDLHDGIPAICNLLNLNQSVIGAGYPSSSEVGLGLWTTYIFASIEVDRLPAHSIDGANEWLRSNNIHVRYGTLEPVITHIPPEFIEYLPIHRGRNELTAGGAVKADIVENLQLEFNDNVFDKAPVPIIEDNKITGLYLPELRKEFNLGSTNGYSIDEIEQRIRVLENPIAISEYSSDLSGTICGISNCRAEFLIDTKSPMRVGCPTSTHKATVLSVMMSDGSQKLMDISNSLLRLESTDSQRFKVSIQENIAGAVGAVIVSGQIELDAKSY